MPADVRDVSGQSMEMLPGSLICLAFFSAVLCPVPHPATQAVGYFQKEPELSFFGAFVHHFLPLSTGVHIDRFRGFYQLLGETSPPMGHLLSV